MTRDYETEYDRIQRRVRETMTPRQRIAYWWDYHKIHTAIAVAAILLAVWLVSQSRSTAADYWVAWVGAGELDGETVRNITAALSAYGEDLDGDGAVTVRLHQIPVDFAAVLERGGLEGQRERGAVMALESDFNIGQSVIFLLEDPESFQRYTGALLNLDGSEPERADKNRLAIAWNQAFPPVDGSGSLYLACKGCWNENQRERWIQSWNLWRRILNAVEIEIPDAPGIETAEREEKQ